MDGANPLSLTDKHRPDHNAEVVQRNSGTRIYLLTSMQHIRKVSKDFSYS